MLTLLLLSSPSFPPPTLWDDILMCIGSMGCQEILIVAKRLSGVGRREDGLSSGYKQNARNLLCFEVLHALWLSAQGTFIDMD